MTDYPALRHFFGAYLHQDWPDEHPDEWAVADEYARDEPRTSPHFADEVSQLLSRHLSEEQLRDLLRLDFGAQTRADYFGWKWRDWLQALADRVEQQLGRSRAS